MAYLPPRKTINHKYIKHLLTTDASAALDFLKGKCETDLPAEAYYLLGTAHYQCENYPQAIEYLRMACEISPDDVQSKELLTKARSNQWAGLDSFLPEISFYSPNDLLSSACIKQEDYPHIAQTPNLQPRSKQLQHLTGNFLGSVFSLAVDVVTSTWGTISGFKGTLWTNWYHKSQYTGLIILAYMRNQLNQHNLYNTYPKGALTAYQNSNFDIPAASRFFRTADGSWNNLSNPKEGAAETRFLRNMDITKNARSSDAEILSPSPREISRRLLSRKGPMKEIPCLNLLAAAWVQFQNHDWFSHGEISYENAFELELMEDDPLRQKYKQNKMLIGRTQCDPIFNSHIDDIPATFINEVTHWWDASQIYGSDQTTVDRLRSGIDGKLRLSSRNTLPLNNTGTEDSGFVRNWWVGLSLLHTLFAREHNAICDYLMCHYPTWEDKRLFNVARLINAAVIAKIHTIEWTPAILPNPGLDMALNANWYGIATNLFKTGKQRNTVAEINISNPELGGVVGNPINKHGQPFGITQEFVEVYRLHSLLPEKIIVWQTGDASASDEISMNNSRQSGSAKNIDKYGVANLLHSFGKQHPGQLVLNNYPAFMQQMTIPGNPVLDLGAVDILRARERNVPRYNEFRRGLGLNPIQKFEDLTENQDEIDTLKQLYGNQPEDIEKLDLMIGTLAESTQVRPTHFGFGETLFQIFILNATRRLQADRFYTDDYNASIYTNEGLEWIDQSDLKAVLLRHYPELVNTGLNNIKNAFEPWDEDELLDKKRHPLRAYDKELAEQPWLGDSYRKKHLH